MIFSFATRGNRAVWIGLCVIVVFLVTASVLLLVSLPDANVFNSQVERIFIENDTLTGRADLKLLEILAQSGTAFSDTLASYRVVIFVLLAFSCAMLVSALVFLLLLTSVGRRLAQIERSGIQVRSLVIQRDENMVYLNDLGFTLTPAAIETLSVLAEARMDDDILSGAEIEAMVSGKSASDCEEAAGATRIKRLRDGLGNQIVSELLIRSVTRRGYSLVVAKDAIEVR